MNMIRLIRAIAFVAVFPMGAAMAAPAPQANPVRLRRFALIIGVNDGGPSRALLRYATSDAHTMAHVLQTLGGVDAGDLVLVAEPTRAALDAGFADIEGRLRAGLRAGARSELVVYYSGHSDDEGLLVGRDRMSYDELRKRVQSAPADLRVVILDSCGSGAFTRRKGGVRRPPFLLDASIDTRGHAFLTSSAATEAAQESDRIAASFFTYYLVSGLRGAADVNQDRRVTLQEAFQFASQETLARTEHTQGGPQHAAYEFDLTGTGDMVITDVRTTQAGLVLTPELSGRIAVREANGGLVAELRKPAGNTVELGVDPGDYVVALQGGAGAAGDLEARVTLASGQHATLPRAAFHPGPPRELAVARGDAPASEDGSPPAAPVETLAAVPPPHETASFRAGFLPRPSDGNTDVQGLSFGFIADRVARMRGLQLSLGYNQVDEQLVGTQLAVGANLTLGGFRGTQIAAGANLAHGEARGLQVAAGANVVDGDARGLQVAAGVNVVTGYLRGQQAAAGVNLARAAHGLQVAGGANVAEQIYGVQVAPVNYSTSVNGLQIGVLNVAGDSTGGRVGVVNVARKTAGFSVGVVNVAEHDDGDSIALINLVGNGIHEAALFSTDTALSNFAFKLGGRHLYTLFGIGYQPGDDLAPGPAHFGRGTRRWVYEGGLGWRFRTNAGPLTQLDLEAVNTTIQSELGHTDNPPMVASLRLVAGVRLAPYVTAIAGVGANVAIATSGTDANLGFGLPENVSHSGETTVRLYPGFILGLQI
jgi:hypothetical protein